MDYQFLRQFYQFSEDTSIHIGNLVGYERGADAVPIYIDVNTLATEHSGRFLSYDRLGQVLYGGTNHQSVSWRR